MAQNITLLGASYPDVPQVVLPKTGGGTAAFTDVSDTTATAADVAQGKIFHLPTGEQATGTAEFFDITAAEIALGTDGSDDLDVEISALTTYANSVTGASDTDLSSAVATLAAGYGGGGSMVSGTYTPTENTLYPSFNVGINPSYFLIWTSETVTGKSVKAFKGAFIDFSDTKGAVNFGVSTNNAGSSYSALTASNNGGVNNTFFEKSGTTVNVETNRTTGTYPGNFTANTVYNWLAW